MHPAVPPNSTPLLGSAVRNIRKAKGDAPFVREDLWGIGELQCLSYLKSRRTPFVVAANKRCITSTLDTFFSGNIWPTYHRKTAFDSSFRDESNDTSFDLFFEILGPGRGRQSATCVNAASMRVYDDFFTGFKTYK